MRFFNIKTPFGMYEVCGELVEIGSLVTLKFNLDTENLVDCVLADNSLILRKDATSYLVSFSANYIVYVSIGNDSIDKPVWKAM